MENTFVFTDEYPCIILKYSKLIIKVNVFYFILMKLCNKFN